MHATHVAETLSTALSIGKVSGAASRFIAAEPISLAIQAGDRMASRHLALWADAVDISIEGADLDVERSSIARALHVDPLDLAITGLATRDHAARSFPAALHTLYRTRLPSE